MPDTRQPTPDPKPNPAPGPPPDTAADLRRDLPRLAAWAVAYYDSLRRRPVSAPIRPGDLLRDLPASPPQHAPPDPAAELEAILTDLDTKVLPRLVHWQAPSFFGFFPCNHSQPAILAELVSAVLDVNGMNWATSPAVTELETRMLDWMAEAMGLPASFRSDADNDGLGGGGVIQSTASDATLVALLAARQRNRRLARAREGAPRAGRELSVITSEHAHSSVAKAAMIAGLADAPDDTRHIRLIPADELGRMRADALAAELARTDAPPPVMVAATLGTTSSGAIDPLPEIARAIADGPSPVWLHVDAAWAGAALVCPEHRGMIRGLELADSVCVNPHKWLLTNFDCDLFWTRSRRDLVESLSITPEYLRNDATDSRAVIDYRDWQVPLGRRFRALKLWFVLRMMGVDGLRAHIRRHIALTEWLEKSARADDRFEIAAPRSLALLCIRLRDGDASTRALLERVNASGKAFLSHTVLPASGAVPARYVIRVAIGATLTDRGHVEALWDLLRAEADAVLRSAP